MSAHTPGPWRWDESGNLYPEAPQREYLKAVNEDRWDDAEYVEPIVQTDSGAYGPRGADKPLIAAVPDLLAALKAMVASYDGIRDSLTSPVVLAKLAAADAAIAKAEGR